MRNLKKILALVLALVMSLSLMATASAADFKDASDISENYQTAVNVLEGLKVFKGYAEDNTFRPKGEITRAEVATIIYRIATGDAEDAQASIYTNMTTSFTDLDKAEWARGYINYCHNAQIIKGESASKFNPNGKISGYATLAMILRAMGYGRNGEFEGPQWEINTAAKAKEIGIIDNVMEAQLGSNAPRELVAEILFRALLTEMVDYTILNGYQPNGKTLGYEHFKLESVTGVVMANEWANLNDEKNNDGDKVLAAGKTEMLLADNTTYELAISSDLDVVGQTCTAYMADQDNDGVREVLTELKPDAINVVDYNEGAAKTVSGLATTKLTNDTQWYKNYSESWFEEATSDYLIRYAVEKAKVDSVPAWEEFINVTVKNTVDTRKITATVLDANGKKVERDVDCYVRSIRPGSEITEIDQEIMKEIFYTADRLAVSNVYTEIQDYVYGEVYVGTASTKDVSDTMSWVGFKNEYFTVDVNTKKFASVGNGDSLRIIDNNGDGNAEYVLWVAYTQAKAIDTLSDSLLFSSGLRLGKYTDNNLDSHDELALNDIANYYVIDGKLSIWKADVVTDTIKTKNFKDATVTLSDDTVKGQSAIVNATDLEDNILNMSDKPEYNMYLDEYGYIRTYELAQGKKYALLTEMYSGTLQNYNYINSVRWIAELKSGNDALTERVVANSNGSVFATPSYAWTSRDLTLNGTIATTTSNLNYLQPATAHLGLANNVAGTATGTAPQYRNTNWKRNVFTVGLNEMFDYGRVSYNTLPNGAAAPANSSAPSSFSFTNVAVYSLEDEAVFLETAAKLHTSTSGAQMYRSRVALAGKDVGTVMTRADWENAYLAANRGANAAAWFDGLTLASIYPVYATDYVQLAKQSYAAGTRHYTIDTNYGTKYNTLSNGYVDATVNTEYYIVTPNNVEYKVGYDNLYTIDAEKVRAAYAVAQNTAKDQNGQDYWVADVIVIEVDEVAYDYDNIALMYYNPWETSGQVRNVNSLNNSWRTLQPDYTDLAKIDVVPARTSINGAYVTWGNTPWTSASYGFYRLYGTEPTSETNGNMTAADAKMITADWNKFGIYAGTVKRVTEILSTSGYIDIDLGNGNVKHVTVNGSNFKTPVYRIDGNTAYTINLLNDPTLDRAGVQIGDPVIVVYDNSGKGQAAYIVDARAGADLNNDGRLDWNVPAWLTSQYSLILNSQKPSTPVDTNPITFTDAEVKGVDVEMNGDYGTVTLDNSVAADNTITDLTFKTSATTVAVLNGAATVAGTLTTSTWTNTTDTDLRSWGTPNNAGTVTYTIVLDDGSAATTGDARTITITVNVKAASSDAAVTGVAVKGVNATRVAADTNNGATAGTPIRFQVALTAAQAASTITTDLAVAFAQPVGTKLNVTSIGTVIGSTIAIGSPFTPGTSTITAGGTIAFNVVAEDGTTTRYYEVAITVGQATAAATLAAVPGSSTLVASTLTVPAGVTVTDANLADYLGITVAAGQTYTASVSGKTITIVVSEAGKENTTQTVTWQNEELIITLTAAATSSGQYDVNLVAKTITIDPTGTGGFAITSTIPVSAAVTNAAGATPLVSLSGVTVNLKYDLVSNTGDNNVFQADVTSVGTGDAGKYLRITATATVAGQSVETVTNLLIGSDNVA